MHGRRLVAKYRERSVGEGGGGKEEMGGDYDISCVHVIAIFNPVEPVSSSCRVPSVEEA